VRRALAAATALLACLAGPAHALEPGTHTRTVGDGERTYLLHVPEGHDGEAPVPLVIALHDYKRNAPQMAAVTGLSHEADRHGFAVLYPTGSGAAKTHLLSWNAGECCGEAAAADADDVGAVRAMLGDAMGALRVDAARVYATGFGNGAMMAYRLACEMSDRIAAIAPVAGPQVFPACKPRRPVPVMHVHGLDDPVAPFEGGATRVNAAKPVLVRSSAAAIQAWIAGNGCPRRPEIDRLPNRTDDGTRVSVRRYGPCALGTEVRAYLIDGGGHTWPGGQRLSGKAGTLSRDLDATAEIWRFFEGHTLPGAAVETGAPAAEEP